MYPNFAFSEDAEAVPYIESIQRIDKGMSKDLLEILLPYASKIDVPDPNDAKIKFDNYMG